MTVIFTVLAFLLGFILGVAEKRRKIKAPNHKKRRFEALGLGGFFSYDGTEQNF